MERPDGGCAPGCGLFTRGEAEGIMAQTIAGLVSGGAVFLVYAGLALTLRRFLAWVARRRVREEERVLLAA